MSPNPNNPSDPRSLSLPEIEHIAYLLAQLPDWRRKGLITPSLEARLRSTYALRRDILLAQQRTTPSPAANSPIAANGPVVPPLPSVPPTSAGTPPQGMSAVLWDMTPSPQPSTPAASPAWRLFLQEHALKLIFALATILVLAALRSLLQWDWVDTLAIRLLPAVPLGLTLLFWTFGQKTRAENPWAAFAYHGVTCALLGFDVLTANRYWMQDALPLRTALLLAFALATAAAGMLLRRWREIPYLHLMQTGIAGTLYLALQNLRPDTTAADFRPVPLLWFGGAYLTLAAANLALAWRTKRAIVAAPSSNEAEEREAWSRAGLLWTHLHATLTLVLIALNSAWTGAQPGEWAILALAAGLLYGAGAQMLNAPPMAGVSGVLLAGGGILWTGAENHLALQTASALLLVLSAAAAGLSLYNRRRSAPDVELGTAWRQVGLSNLVIATLLTWLYCARFASMPSERGLESNLTGAILAAICGLFYLVFALWEKEAAFLYGTTLNFGVALLSGLYAVGMPELTSATALGLYGVMLCCLALLSRTTAPWLSPSQREGGKAIPSSEESAWFAMPLGNSGQIAVAAGAIWFAGVMNSGSFLHLLFWTLFVFAWTGAYLGAARLLNRPGFVYMSWLTFAFGTMIATLRDSGITLHQESILLALWLVGSAAFAWGCFRAAIWTEKPVHSYLASMLLTWSYLNGLALFVRPSEVYFGLWMLPLWIGMFAAGQRAASNDANRDALLWQPLRRIAVFLSALTLALTVGMADRWLSASEEARPALATLTLLAYSAAYGLLAAFRQTPRTMAVCAVTLTLAYTHHLLTQTALFGGTLSWPHFAFYTAQAGVFWLTMGWNICRRWQKPEPAKLLLVLAGAIALCCASVGMATVQTPHEGRWSVLTLAWCGAIWFGLWLLEQGEICLHVGAWNLLLGWMLIIYDHYGVSLDSLDMHLLPVGLYLLMIGFREGKREHLDTAHFFWWAGLLLLMTPPFLGYWNHGAAWHTVLLLLECVGAVLFGIGQRIRAFVCTGFLFAALFGASHATGHLPEVWGTFAALLLGVGLFIAGFYALTHREILQRWLAVGERQWQAWRAWR